MSTWLIRIGGIDYTPKELKLSVVGGQWASGSASSVSLRARRRFDATELVASGAAVTIKRDGVAFFTGKCRQIPKGASGPREFQEYLVLDAWADLERQIYQEPWGIRQTGYAGAAWSPRVLLGQNSSGVRINMGEQIFEALYLAISMGVDLQIGTIPDGMLMHPQEVNAMSCAAVIRESLRYHLDWIPWIDHSTTPPTFRVTPRADATAVSINVAGLDKLTGLDITRTEDRVPAGVRIIYKSAHMIEDAGVYRTFQIDQYPTPTGTTEEILEAVTAPVGDGFLTTEVELQGMRQEVEKQQVVVREMPTDSTTAKAYLKTKFPHIADLADSDWNVTEWERAVIPEEGDPVQPIDTKLERLYGTGLTGDNGLKNELVDGAIHEWMQKHVGRVLVKFKAEATGTATVEEEELISQLPPWFTVVATNAVTKIYRGTSSFTAAEDAPVGVAQAFMQSLEAGCNFAGSVPIIESDIGATQWHGKKLNLEGGDSEWEEMDAPIHTVSWDLRTRQSVISFGPNPDFDIEGFIAYLRLLSRRENTEYTTAERTGDEYGDADGISARGDKVGPTWTPQTVTGGGAGGGAGGPRPFQLVTSGEAGDNVLKVRESTIASTSPSGFTDGIMDLTISDSAGVVYAKLTINGTTGAVTAVAVEKASTLPSNTDTVHHELIGSYTVTGSGGSAVITANNARYGPIPANICRNWYAGEAPFFGVTFL